MSIAAFSFFPTTGAGSIIMRSSSTTTTNPESKASTRKSARSKSKEKAASNAPASQAPSDPRVGTRSVNTLSEAQLERKRANDREAQRIIRKRTREHIENLERQVAELSEQKDQLSEALQHNSELEAQIAALQRQLTDMALMLQYRQSPGPRAYPDTGPAYATTSQTALNEPSLYSVPVSHGYVPTTTVDSRPLYTPYDMQMPMHGPISLPREQSSSGVSSIASTSYTDEVDATVTQKYNVHPGPNAPSMQVYAHQGVPVTTMTMPGHQYHYPTSYNPDPWNQNRPS